MFMELGKQDRKCDECHTEDGIVNLGGVVLCKACADKYKDHLFTQAVRNQFDKTK